MWLERFVIIAGSLRQDFLASSWHEFMPTWVDWSLLIGSIGLFSLLYLAFLRWVPFIPLSELQAQRHEERAAPFTGDEPAATLPSVA
jgi:molybdopterin-containing oxidoreductase family membrane subunit